MHWFCNFLAVTALGAAAAIAAMPAFHAGLSTRGKVWTNSVVLPSGSTVHPGDRISTDAAGMAVVSSPQTGRIEIRPETEVTLGEDHVVLHRGAVATQRLTVRAGHHEVRVRGAEKGGLIVVASREGRHIVAAERGDALITNGADAAVLVPAGSYAMTAIAPNKDRSTEDGGMPADHSKAGDAGGRDGKNAEPAGRPGAAGTAAHPAPQGWTIGPLSHAADVVARAIRTGAAAFGGAVAGEALMGNSPSPSRGRPEP